jgi:hypothetical protein
MVPEVFLALRCKMRFFVPKFGSFARVVFFEMPVFLSVGGLGAVAK